MSERGHIILALLFMLLLAATGLALLTNTGIHVQIIAARRNKWLEASRLEQALLLDLHRYREKLAATDMNAFQAPENEFFNKTVFPELDDDGQVSCHQFSFCTLRRGDDYRVIRIFDLMRTSQHGSRLRYAGRSGVELFMGSIPAGEFGMLVKQESMQTPDAFLAGRGVEYAGAQLPQVGKFTVNSETELLLSEALQLPCRFPDWRRIREKFNLEPSDLPVPPGVYLVQTGKEIVAIFVQGDLEKLEFMAGNGWQSIAFRQEGRRCELRYQPGLGSAVWSGLENVGGFLFAEKIIVHGNVWDIEQVGAAAFLSASRIELLACGRMVVSSGLESENLALGKEKLPGLLLMTSNHDFFSGAEGNADIVFTAVGTKTVQAQVVAAGTLVNGDGRVEITGSLFAGDIRNSGRLRVDAAAGEFSFSRYVRLPDFKFLKNFRVHFIEEEADE
jgi:hypothetical protein